MIKWLLLFFAVVIGSMVSLHRSMQDGSFLRYVDQHSDPRWTPHVLYRIGQGEYLFQNLPEAATYFARIPEKFPKSPFADPALFYSTQILEDQSSLSRDELADAYQKYLEAFPNGQFADTAKSRIESYRTGARSSRP